MIKFGRGYVTNPETYVSEEIVVKAVTPNSIKDALIGGGLVLMGITYLTVTAFKKGALAMEEAEFKALEDAGLAQIKV